MNDKKSTKVEVVFSIENEAIQDVHLTGLSVDILSRPEQIRKVMELLGMPEGTVARILHTTEDVIVR
ncbi:hypothetical protein J8Z69_15560 [Acinetobacter nosocomialis]|uniref:hypothetical protein n=1 Tax=Acinetobacter nosocomialis TaxID=106654 RepID=UPI000ECEF388|nr:hypothetical protein [Acinetobacter nosocomialis]MBP1495712.1 hypothetical protein [Acinetobacter nosocomialis]RJE70049.1 hypothetical protein AMS70_12160 [Acinetobacter sp. JS678]